MGVLDWKLRVTMPNGEKYDVPVRIIAEDRARYFAEHDGITFEESLDDDTIPVFESDYFEIEDWAANNMNWSDVSHAAVKVEQPSPPTDLDAYFQDGWVNGEKEIIED